MNGFPATISDLPVAVKKTKKKNNVEIGDYPMKLKIKPCPICGEDMEQHSSVKTPSAWFWQHANRKGGECPLTHVTVYLHQLPAWDWRLGSYDPKNKSFEKALFRLFFVTGPMIASSLIIIGYAINGGI